MGGGGNTDYRISAFAEDLRSYFVMDMSYDVIIGHSFWRFSGIISLPFVAQKERNHPYRETGRDQLKSMPQGIANVKAADVHMVRILLGHDRDCVLRTLGFSMCNRSAVEVFRQNSLWSSNGLLKNIPPHVKITVLVSDPKFSVGICDLET
ncbi:hypothetical protein EDB19DRAFT_1737085 [Suillus lakei]|nr:hypothetical protein EDB19DRAFT_1737085 [Suillus lakei]